ncbi:glycosyltransferase family 2 protein [Portibacter lacus]|uniref:Glycosyltransferase n=1 Tax=Portibacter lacus TaxID=1099794 RepID=A0AA37WE64_9BACT|nr:glycosyltransferase family 2 protein [Portibacter lacus]GLR17578.1 glycosyltransferase [Portibacter lacus]
MQKSISIVIPVYNEEGNVATLFHEITEVCITQRYTYEIIFIDDKSKDNTLQELKKLSPAKIIAFRKNFGQTQALDAGLKLAKYPIIVTMDGDGQNDPSDIPKMISILFENDYDMVSGWRKNRKDPVGKKIVSRTANFLRKKLINDGIQDSGCALKVYKKECFDDLSLYGEMHRFIPALLKIKGFTIGEMVVNHRPRLHGVSKYSWRRGLKAFIDMISVWYWKKFAVRPLHLLGGMGLIIILFGFLSGLITVYEFAKGQDMSETIWPMITLFSFLIGLQIFISGLLADMLNKSYYESRDEMPYSIKEVIITENIKEVESIST